MAENNKERRPVEISKVYRPASGQNDSSGNGGAQNSYQGPTGSREPKNPPNPASAGDKEK